EVSLLRGRLARPRRVPARAGGRFRQGDLLEIAWGGARGVAGTLLGPPRNRSVERPVELEHPWPVAVTLEQAAINRGEPVAGQSEQTLRGYVEEHQLRLLELGERLDAASGLDLSTQRPEI